MKKTYSAPVINVERFEVEDIITTSGVIEAGKVTTDGTKEVYEVLVETQW